MKICKQCTQSFKPVNYRSTFCSRSCSAVFNNRRRGTTTISTKCVFCNQTFSKPTHYKGFCSRVCSGAYKQNQRIQMWRSGSHFPTDMKTIRQYLICLHGKRCSNEICGITDMWVGKSIVLEVDHINGISTDHRCSNVRLLCPNCHSQTNTYGGRNKNRIV